MVKSGIGLQDKDTKTNSNIEELNQITRSSPKINLSNELSLLGESNSKISNASKVNQVIPGDYKTDKIRSHESSNTSYEEPVLTNIIVKNYEGNKVDGLYHGFGTILFEGGNIYRGDLLEGLMHGTGEYTWSDGVVYTGSFLKNKISGRGIYLWPDGSNYEGDVLDGKRHGFGVFRAEIEEKFFCYIGMWDKGKKHGKGRMEFDKNGSSFYEGDWVENVKHGIGTFQYPSGNIYEGMWWKNLRHGEGTMRWVDKNQMYSGNWKKGVQNGIGQHIWFFRRISGSQYPMRNFYEGEFKDGLRHGAGTFYYSNGAKYEGDWKKNMKDGQGKFTFKNGRIYEGVFKDDHIMEYPTFTIDGIHTPDTSQIRTRTPLAMEELTNHSYKTQNTHSPSFQLEIDPLLSQFNPSDREEECQQILFVVMRHMTNLRKIYNFYSSLGYDESPDNTFVMTRLQFWRLLKDCRCHHYEFTLVNMDHFIEKSVQIKGDSPKDTGVFNPFSKILFREFLNYLIVLSYFLLNSQNEEETPIISRCFSKLINENLLKYSCQVKGFFYYENRRSFNVLIHADPTYEIFKQFYQKKNNSLLTMRDLLFMLKDFHLINQDLTAKAIIDILRYDDPSITDEGGAINLERQITFLEFIEALVGCAEIYVTDSLVKEQATPLPSVEVTPVASIMSATSTHSKPASQAGADADWVVQSDIPPQANSPLQASLSQMTHKTLDGSHTNIEAQFSNATCGSEQLTAGVTLVNSENLEGSKKSATIIGDLRKSTSFISSKSVLSETPAALQSMASISSEQKESLCDAYTIDANEDGISLSERSETVLDEETKKFNFWTHQVHIFFVRKFFPAADNFINLTQT